MEFGQSILSKAMAKKPLSLSEIQSRVEDLQKELDELKLSLREHTSPEKAKVAEKNIRLATESIIEPTRAPEPNFLLQKWEAFIGENLFIKLGLATILLGAIWFINLAFEEYWINESVRIWLGIISGIGMVLYGLKITNSWPLIGPSLIGTGISFIFVSYFLGYELYDLYTSKETFAGLLLLNLFSVSLSFFLRKEAIFGLGLFGTFLVPILLSTGENSYFFLFSYLLLWNLLFVWLSQKTKWQITPLLLLLGNHLVYTAWAWDRLVDSNFWIPLVFQTSIFFLYLYKEFSIPNFKSERQSVFSFATTGLNLVFAYLQAYYISHLFYPNFQTVHLLFLLVAFLVGYLYSFQKNSIQIKTDLIFNGNLILFFLLVLATLSLNFEDRVLSIILLAFAGVLSLFGSRMDLASAKIVALVFWLYHITHLVFAHPYPSSTAIIILNVDFFLFLATSGLLYYLHIRLQQEDPLKTLFLYASIPILVIGSFFQVYDFIPSPYKTLAYTSIISGYGLIFTFYSFINYDARLRKIGLFFLSLVILKLYLYDFWNMGTIARIFAGFGLGLSLVLAGIFYNRSKKKLEKQ
ncbi:DUF2339 domain-containing protein [Leptospira ryugenii]|nr:DUF2339 domain-containing protein [Leptospira ryugenii]